VEHRRPVRAASASRVSQPAGIIEPVTDVRVSRPSRRRRVAGGVVALLTVVLAVLFVLGAWNPWRLVALQGTFGNPWFGLFVTAAMAYLALWLLAPVRNEAVQRRGLAARVVAVVAAVIGLLGWGMFGVFYSAQTTELARSADGTRTLVIVARDIDSHQELRVWAGSGWGAREVGVLGLACGSITARFVGTDAVELDTAYGAWRLALDPATGAPREVLGPRCADGPVPATMEP
jgi:hypothetical protein